MREVYERCTKCHQLFRMSALEKHANGLVCVHCVAKAKQPLPAQPHPGITDGQ